MLVTFEESLSAKERMSCIESALNDFRAESTGPILGTFLRYSQTISKSKNKKVREKEK